MAQLSVLNCSEITFRLLAEGTKRAKRSHPESWALLHASDNWRRRWRRSTSARQEHGFHTTTHGRPCCENKMPFKIIKAQEKCIFKAEDVPTIVLLVVQWMCAGACTPAACWVHCEFAVLDFERTVEISSSVRCWMFTILIFVVYSTSAKLPLRRD